ncbi:hypothetical protein L6164_018393 [Bauhinia variegata]|uniref:Uncharacterized protein n=1 Tax=Bauhinia variegata TaxID=167791 RepID=A0ACB9NCT6_BAUVA|nr:hypothetical protein L6164_018393 [Bauhinia variegata]
MLLTPVGVDLATGILVLQRNCPELENCLRSHLSSEREEPVMISKMIDASYYGHRDDEDGVLERLNVRTEKKMTNEAVEEWNKYETIKKEARKRGEVVTVTASGRELRRKKWWRKRQKEREMREKLEEKER